ncbi:uncharacterized protein [Heterodontus francisci]|uniref:uncharacterized protein n=1 Tax=Heterodontus francisci TaxID=7792 RepID=UPI00355B8B69
MWEVGDTYSVQGEHVCRKCLQLELLEIRVLDLEWRLETLWSIREAVITVDSTYREVVTPQMVEVAGLKDAAKKPWQIAAVHPPTFDVLMEGRSSMKQLKILANCPEELLYLFPGAQMIDFQQPQPSSFVLDFQHLQLLFYRAEKFDQDTDTRLIGKDLFQGLEGSGGCYVLKEVIDFYLGNVLASEELHNKYSHLKEVKEFLTILMKRHMFDCDAEDKKQANENIKLLKEKLNQVSETREAKVIGELFMLLQEIGTHCSAPIMTKRGHQKKPGADE